MLNCNNHTGQDTLIYLFYNLALIYFRKLYNHIMIIITGNLYLYFIPF